MSPLLRALPIVIACLSATFSAAADEPPGCWPPDLPVPSGLTDAPGPGPCVAMSRELAEVTSWKFRSPPARLLSELRRSLTDRDWGIQRRIRRVREHAWDRVGDLEIRASRGDRQLLFLLRPDVGGSRLVIYDWTRN